MKELIYQVIDLLTFGRDLTKKKLGHPLRLSSRYINHFPTDYDANHFAFFKQPIKAGDTLLNIGARIGSFANIWAQMVGQTGKIYAFKPIPSTHATLQKMSAHNRHAAIVAPVNKAVGKNEGTIAFCVSNEPINNTNSVLAYRNKPSHRPIDIPLSSADNLVRQQGLGRVNFIKIDVERAEYDTIKDAADNIRRHQPASPLAIHPLLIAAKGDELDAMYDFVLGLGYRIALQNKPLDRKAFCRNQVMVDLHLYPA